MPLPNPAPAESQDDFMARCIPVALEEFPDEAQASAVCYTQYEQGFRKEKYRTLETNPLTGGKFAEYPWDECIRDMKSQGYSEEAANNICGAIKAGTARGGRR